MRRRTEMETGPPLPLDPLDDGSTSLFYEAATTICSYITTTISPSIRRFIGTIRSNHNIVYKEISHSCIMTSSHLLIVLVGIHYIRNYVIRDRNQNHPPLIGKSCSSGWEILVQVQVLYVPAEVLDA